MNTIYLRWSNFWITSARSYQFCNNNNSYRIDNSEMNWRVKLARIKCIHQDNLLLWWKFFDKLLKEITEHGEWVASKITMSIKLIGLIGFLLILLSLREHATQPSITELVAAVLVVDRWNTCVWMFAYSKNWTFVQSWSQCFWNETLVLPLNGF